MSTSNQTEAKTRYSDSDITDIIGLKVYTSGGVYLGVVEDVRVDFRTNDTTALALNNVNPEVKEVAGGGEGVVIPYNWVESVHDIVLTIDVVERLSF